MVRAQRHVRLDEAPRAEVLMPFAQHPMGSLSIVARTAVAPETLIETAKLAVWGIDPLQTFYRTATLDELVERTLTTRRFALIVLTGIRRAGAAARGRRAVRRAQRNRVAVSS